MERRLRSPGRNRLGVWEPTASAGQYKADEVTSCIDHAIPKQSTPTTGRRVLLSGGPNQYQLAVFSVFHVLVCDLRVLSLRFHLSEQLNHSD
jgi:hypothetical protein